MKNEKALWWGAVALFVLSSAAIVLRGGAMLPLGPVSLLFLLIPAVGERLFRMKLGMPMRLSILLFCLLAFNLGTALRWYHRFPGYDKAVHFLSGILFGQLGLCLYGRIGGDYDRGAKVGLQMAFAVCFAMCVAGIWEIFEYTGFLLTGHDAQNVAATGIHDTMQDMIACLLGSLVLVLGTLRYARRGGSLLMVPVLAFDSANAEVGKEANEKAQEEEKLYGST